MDNIEMDRLAAWLTRQSPKRLGYLGRLRYAGMPERHLGPIAWALYRRQHGLEARALVALVMAPQVIDAGRESLELRQLLTPPYVALASLLLDPETSDAARERTRDQLAGRSYLPPAADGAAWEAEARACLAELRARRARWDSRAASQVAVRRARANRRREESASQATAVRRRSRHSPH